MFIVFWWSACNFLSTWLLKKHRWLAIFRMRLLLLSSAFWFPILLWCHSIALLLIFCWRQFSCWKYWMHSYNWILVDGNSMSMISIPSCSAIKKINVYVAHSHYPASTLHFLCPSCYAMLLWKITICNSLYCFFVRIWSPVRVLELFAIPLPIC
jgi:hypothetical protein